MKRHPLFLLWFAILVILSTSVCLASGSYDNLHIYYTGNRITGVLEDADPVTQDYLGNNRAVVNGSTGEIEQTVAYYPYGAVIADLGISTLNQPFKFGGKELTMQNGLNEYDFGARQYYPAVPGFTSIDSKCEKYYWLSPYLYCANNPVNAVDPTGNVVICLDEQAQRNISLSLTEDEERFVKFVDGKIDVNLLNQCESTSENMTALKAVANSETSFYVATAEKYTTNGEKKNLKNQAIKAL